MITIPGFSAKINTCATAAMLCFTIHASAQQLYSDSARMAMEQQTLQMIQPDTAFIAVVAPEAPVSRILVRPCGFQNFDWNNWSQTIYPVIASDYYPGYYPVTACVPVFIGPTAIVPPVTEYALGLPACVPAAPVKNAAGSGIANATQELTAMLRSRNVPESFRE